MATGRRTSNHLTADKTKSLAQPQAEKSVTKRTGEKKAKVINKWSRNGLGLKATATGKFSSEESAVIRDAIIRYCEAKGIEPARLCSECEHKSELKGAWVEIAQCIPDRSVQAVYRHGLRQLHPFKRGSWSDEDCIMLVELVARFGKRWAFIQNKLNRSADSCRDKHRELGQNSEYNRGRWDVKERDTLIKYVWEFCVKTFPENVLHSAIVEDFTFENGNANKPGCKLQKLDPEVVPPTLNLKLLGAAIDKYGKSDSSVSTTIPWSTISKRMGNRSRLSCFKKWQKLVGVSNSAKSLALHAQEHGIEATIDVSKKGEMLPDHPNSSLLLPPRIPSGNFLGHNSIGHSSFLETAMNPLGVVLQQQTFTGSLGSATGPSIAERRRAFEEKQGLKDSSQFNNDANMKYLGINPGVSDTSSDADLKLLEHLVNLNKHNVNDVLWSSIIHPQGSLDRWKFIASKENVDYSRSVVEAAREVLARWRLGVKFI